MARTCTVCGHPDREEIDRALVAGESCYSLAERYSTISRMALQRHKDNHLPAALAQATAAAEVAHGDSLIAKAQTLEAEARRLGKKAEDAGDLRTALQAVRELVRIVELQGKLLGELQERPVNVLLLPEWLQIRGVLLAALGPYPEARLAVAGELMRLDGGERNN